MTSTPDPAPGVRARRKRAGLRASLALAAVVGIAASAVFLSFAGAAQASITTASCDSCDGHDDGDHHDGDHHDGNHEGDHDGDHHDGDGDHDDGDHDGDHHYDDGDDDDPSPEPTETEPPPPPPPDPDPEPTETAEPTETPAPVPAGSTGSGGPGALKPGPEPTDDPQLVTEALPPDDDPVAAPAHHAPAPAPEDNGPPPHGDPAAPSVLSHAIPGLRDLLNNPVAFATAGGIGALILLLLSIPAKVLDSIIEANGEMIAGWWHRLDRVIAPIRRLRTRLSRIPHPHLSPALMILLVAVLFGFSDPEFGIDLTSLRLVMSLAIGLLLVMLLPIVITRVTVNRRWHAESRIVVQPGALVLTALGVIASRVLGFNPGLLIGLVLGLDIAAQHRRQHRTRAIVVRIGTMVLIAVAAWLTHSWLEEVLAEEPPTFGGELLLDSLVAATVEGLAGAAVALVPVAFLDGLDLFRKSKAIWAAMAIPTTVLFALLVLPTVLAEEGPDVPPAVGIGALFGFSLLVFAVWLTFHFLHRRERAREAAAGDEHASSTEKHEVTSR